MQERELLIKYCRKVYEKGFVAATDGNLSLKLDNNRILITPSSKSKGDITEDELLLIDSEGNILEGEGKISTEVKIHLLAYNHRSEIKGVVHCHPIYATAFASFGEGFTKPVFPEVILTLGKVPLCRYATPSTDRLPDSILPFIDYANAFLLENHGALTIGNSIKEAYFRMEKLEHTANILYLTRTMGREKTIPHNQLKELYEVAEKTYGITLDKRNKFI